MTVAVLGTGLIGGSIGLALTKVGAGQLQAGAGAAVGVGLVGRGGDGTRLVRRQGARPSTTAQDGRSDHQGQRRSGATRRGLGACHAALDGNAAMRITGRVKRACTRVRSCTSPAS